MPEISTEWSYQRRLPFNLVKLCYANGRKAGEGQYNRVFKTGCIGLNTHFRQKFDFCFSYQNAYNVPPLIKSGHYLGTEPILNEVSKISFL